MELTQLTEAAERTEQFEPLREALKLPEDIGLLEGPEAGETSECPFTYSEAYTDENSIYHPGQIKGICAGSLSDPRVRELTGDLGQWQRQERGMSCAVQVQREIINSVQGLELTESELRTLAEARDWYSDETGTYAHDVGRIAEECFGMERSQYKGIGLEALMALKEQGYRLILGVDHHRLARPQLNRPFKADHAVELLDFDLSDKENPKVILNDPGRDEGRGSVYPLEIFLKAAGPADRAAGKPVIHFVTALKKEADDERQ